MKRRSRLIAILAAAVMTVVLMPASAFAQDEAVLDALTISEAGANALGAGTVEGASVTITEQPQSATVSYPEGASFQVTVDHPENVASWQWYKEDPVGHVFELEGETAKTATLKVLSTYDKTGTDKFYCTITDKDGNTVTSDKAELKIANPTERKPVLYVSEYAVKPGETLDIENTGLSGSGTIALSDDGKEITFNDFKMTNDWYSAGHICANGFGVTLYYLEAPSGDYKVTLNGENVINNLYVDLAGGSGSDLGLLVTGEPSVCTIEGPGSLTLQGGDFGILSYLSLDINTSSLKTVPNLALKRMDGIVTESGADVTIKSGVALDLDVIGRAVFVDGDLTLDSGSRLKVTSRAPYQPSDIATGSRCIKFGQTMSMKDAELVIDGIGDPSIFPKGWVIGSFAGIESKANAILSAENSTITINMNALDGDKEYANSIGGIALGDGGAINLKSTDLTIDVNSENIHGGFGIVVPTDFYVSDGSNIEINIRTNDRVRGIAAYPYNSKPESGDFEITDSNVTVSTESLNGDVDSTFGIRAGKNCSISLAEGYSVKSTAKGGKAFVALTGDSGYTPEGYQPGYKPTHIQFGEDTDCVLPNPYEINLTSVPDAMPSYDYGETFYVPGETDRPVDDVLITHATPARSIEDAVISDISDQTYTSKAIEPEPAVTLDGVTLVKDVDYTLSYKNNEDVGTAEVVVEGKGNYTGSVTKPFNIIPKGTKLTSVTGGKKQFTAKWKKQATQTTGYKVQYSTSKTFASGNKTVTVKSPKTVSKKVKGLKSKKTYYVRVRTYAKVDGKAYCSAWSAKKAVKTS